MSSNVTDVRTIHRKRNMMEVNSRLEMRLKEGTWIDGFCERFGTGRLRELTGTLPTHSLRRA